MNESDNIKEAKAILGGKVSEPEAMLRLAKNLKAENAFGYARKVLALARNTNVTDPFLRFTLRQQHALCTYKDADLQAAERLDAALEILAGGEEDLSTTRNQETLGIAGAIHKRKWEVDGQKKHLDRSLTYYTRGYQEGVKNDYGYTGINAAYVLDLLAALEIQEGAAEATAITADDRREKARAIRMEIVRSLPPLLEAEETSWLENQWWFLVTMAEAHFGLRDYPEAVSWLKRAKQLSGVVDWEREATARQLANLARLHVTSGGLEGAAQLKDSPGWNALRDFYEPYADAVEGVFIGKIGLALTGEGFRAALFNVGVLAKLAEMNMLGGVEVLSCVGGGAIVGSLYYLKLRRLLQENKDADISRDDYVRIVEDVADALLVMARRNVNSRVRNESITALKRIFLPGYTDAKRVARIYERELFMPASKDTEELRDIAKLTVSPLGEAPGFSPKYHNWRRTSKVPALILNATTLNTGHNWQFTTTWMGEPPSALHSEEFVNSRLRRMYYWQAPERQREVSLGEAVAASACAPGTTDPLVFSRLYPGMKVRLVGGSVSDRFGFSALLDQDCKVLLLADGGVRLATEGDPAAGANGVSQRAVSVLKSQLGAAQFGNLRERLRASLIRDLIFVSLGKGLVEDPLTWIGYDEKFEAATNLHTASSLGPLTMYGVSTDFQKRLAAIPADADSFSVSTAYALMTSGYLIAEEEFSKCRAFGGVKRERVSWRFLAIEEPMKSLSPSQSSALLAAPRFGFGLWRLPPWLKLTGLLMVLLLMLLMMAALSPAMPLEVEEGWLMKSFRMTLTEMLTTFGILVVAYTVWRMAKGLVKPASPATLVHKAEKPINSLIAHSNHIEALAAMLELFGYKVERTPRLGHNPLGFSLDIFAQLDHRGICAEVKTGGKSIRSFDWRAAAQLATAAHVFREQMQPSMETLDRWLVLVDAEPDASLDEFCQQQGIELIRLEAGELAKVSAMLDGESRRDVAVRLLGEHLYKSQAGAA